MGVGFPPPGALETEKKWSPLLVTFWGFKENCAGLFVALAQMLIPNKQVIGQSALQFLWVSPTIDKKREVTLAYAI